MYITKLYLDALDASELKCCSDHVIQTIRPFFYVAFLLCRPLVSITLKKSARSLE